MAKLTFLPLPILHNHRKTVTCFFFRLKWLSLLDEIHFYNLVIKALNIGEFQGWLHNQYHHHNHVVPLARISLTLSRHFSLSFIASDRFSGLYPISSHSCCMYVRAGRSAFAWPYAGDYRSTSLMSSSLLLQQCPACLVRLAWIVFVMGGRWPYSYIGCALLLGR